MDPHANFAYSTVATAPSPATSGTSLVVQAGDGAKFPSAPFNVTIWPAGVQPISTNAEIVTVTAVSTDTFTIVRSSESTSARTVVVGDQIAQTVTAKTLTDAEDHYLTPGDQYAAAGTQAIFDDYFEIASPNVYELASSAVLVVGDFSSPLAEPDQQVNLFASTSDELLPTNGEVIFSDYYEVANPYAFEIANGGVLQLGTGSDIGATRPPGYEWGYDQITSNVNIVSTTEATGTTVIACAPHWFDGAPVLVEFFAPNLDLPSSAVDANVVLSLFESTTQITRLALAFTFTTSSARADSISGKYRFTPTQGVHTYTLTAFATSTTGTPAVRCGSGGTGGASPAYLRFTKA